MEHGAEVLRARARGQDEGPAGPVAGVLKTGQADEEQVGVGGQEVFRDGLQDLFLQLQLRLEPGAVLRLLQHQFPPRLLRTLGGAQGGDLLLRLLPVPARAECEEGGVPVVREGQLSDQAGAAALLPRYLSYASGPR